MVTGVGTERKWTRFGGFFERPADGPVRLEDAVPGLPGAVHLEDAVKADRPMDGREAEDAVRVLLRFMGEDPEREGLRDTPARVARALREMTAGYQQDPAALLARSFDEHTDELVLVRDIPFVSLCEHHLLPFAGEVHVGYMPGDRVVGLSKVARLVDVYAHRLQIQERMTQEIAWAIMEHARAEGAGVVVTATHACMSNRGIRKPGARMVTSAMLGTLRSNPAQRAELLSLTR